jgi:high-affinity Fe2+/Pb2+ permease
MDNFWPVMMAIAMLAAFLLDVGGVKLALDRRNRGRGILMMAVPLVLIMNVTIWTM